MTRNKKRSRLKSGSTDAVATPAVKNGLAGEPRAESRALYDCEEPVVDDSIEAWKYVMVLVLEQYLPKIDKEMKKVKSSYYTTPSDTSYGKLLLNLAKSHFSILEEVKSLEDRKRRAKEIFVDNIAKLSKGFSYKQLPLIDKDVTLAHLDRLIASHCCGDSEGSVSSRTSGDSAIDDVSSNGTSSNGSSSVDVVLEERNVLMTTDQYISQNWPAAADVAAADEIYEDMTYEDDEPVATAADVLELLKPMGHGFASCLTAATDVNMDNVFTSGLVISNQNLVTDDQQPVVPTKPTPPVSFAALVTNKPPITGAPLVTSKPLIPGKPLVSNVPSVTCKRPIPCMPLLASEPPITSQPLLTSTPPVTGKPPIISKPPVPIEPSVTNKPPVVYKPLVNDVTQITNTLPKNPAMVPTSTPKVSVLKLFQSDLDQVNESMGASGGATQDSNDVCTEKEWTTISKKKKAEKMAKPAVVIAPPSVTTASVQTPWDNGKFHGERGEMRKKTELCKNFKLGICGWGSDCNYAHSESERAMALSKASSVVKQKSSGSATVIHLATLLAAEDPTPSANVKFKGAEGEKLRKTEMCENFKKGKCNWGDECNYAHNPDQLKNLGAPKEKFSCSGSGLVINPTPAGNWKFKNGQKQRKTEMCENFKKGKCGWGKECNYAHSETELRGGDVEEARAASTKPKKEAKIVDQPATGQVYSKKLLMCKGHELGVCKRSATDCKYAHHVDELDQVYNHTEPCDKQQCAGRLRYERRKTVMCPDVSSPKGCKFGADCTYAHRRAELRLMPKHELCLRHKKGRCNTPAAECVYAHSKEELRPRTPERRPSVPSSNQNQTSQEQVDLNLKLRWNEIQSRSQRQMHTTEEECLICTQPLDDRIDLECGHDVWHFKCISKWLNERRSECPLCSKPAHLPDLFQAPAGLDPKDFPAL